MFTEQAAMCEYGKNHIFFNLKETFDITSVKTYDNSKAKQSYAEQVTLIYGLFKAFDCTIMTRKKVRTVTERQYVDKF